MAVELERLVVRLIADATKYQDGMKKAAVATKKLQQESKRAAAAEQKQNQLMQRGADVTRSVETATDQYNRKNRELNSLLRKGAINQETHRRAVARVGREFTATQPKVIRLGVRIRTMALKAGAAMRRAGASVKSFGTSIRSAAMRMTMMVTGPIAAIGGVAVMQFSKFEASLSKIVGLVGLSAEEVENFKKKILDLAGPTSTAPVELADAMFFITSAGLRGADAIETLEMAAKASAAGMGETKVVADLVTSAMNAYGAENLSAAQATDILSATINKGKAEAAELSAALGQVLPIASEMGTRFDEVGAAIAAMTLTGTSASTAGMQLKNILVSLKKPSKEAEKALTGLGLSSAGLRANIKEKGLLTVLKILSEKFKDNEEALTAVFGNIRAMSGVMDLLGNNVEDNLEVFDALANATGSLDNAFAAAQKTTKFKWNQALTELKVALIDIGDVLAPTIGKLIGWMRRGVEWFKGLSRGTKVTTVVVAGLVAIVGPLLLIFSLLVGAIGAAITAVSTIASVIATIGWPVVLAVVVIGALIAALMGVAAAILPWKKILGALKTFAHFAMGFVANFSENMRILWGWLKRNWLKVLDYMGRLFLKFVEVAISNAGTLVKTTIKVFMAWQGWLGAMFKRVFTVDFVMWVGKGIVRVLNMLIKFQGKFHKILLAAVTGRDIDMGGLFSDFEKEYNRGAESTNIISTMAGIAAEGVEEMADAFSTLANVPLNMDIPEFNLTVGGQPPEDEAADEAADAAEKAGAKVAEAAKIRAVVVYTVEGIQAVEAGTAEAMGRIREYLSLKEKDEKVDRDKTVMAAKMKEQEDRKRGAALSAQLQSAQLMTPGEFWGMSEGDTNEMISDMNAAAAMQPSVGPVFPGSPQAQAPTSDATTVTIQGTLRNEADMANVAAGIQRLVELAEEESDTPTVSLSPVGLGG